VTSPTNRATISPCQICGKTNHSVFKCSKMFDASYMGEKNANVVMSYGVDSNWYVNFGSTDHVTGELDKLAVRDTYSGGDQIYTVSGSGMHIAHVGKYVIHTLCRNLHLNNMIHVPQVSKNLASIHHIASDNNVFFELHPNVFFIKDRESRRTLPHGRSRGGLYPLPSSPSSNKFIKQAFGATKIPMSRWYAHLGHPSSSITRFVLSKHCIPLFSDVSHEYVCGACQQAKNHQLPYDVSTSRSKVPLELVFSDVWSPACDSISKNKYYNSFIDDFSKFTWIYLLRHKSEVFQKFQEFQCLDISHHVTCPYAHQQNGSAERKQCHNVEVGLSLLAHASSH
jgi:hypothetical protein